MEENNDWYELQYLLERKLLWKRFFRFRVHEFNFWWALLIVVSIVVPIILYLGYLI